MQALAGAFALDSLSLEVAGTGLGDLSGTARGLYRIAAARSWDLDEADRARLADLARAVREIVNFKPIAVGCDETSNPEGNH